MWFDAYEYNLDAYQALPFPWIQLLKAIIFDLFKGEDDKVDMGVFEKQLRSKLRDGSESITYSDVLFSRKGN